MLTGAKHLLHSVGRRDQEGKMIGNHQAPFLSVSVDCPVSFPQHYVNITAEVVP